MSKQVKSIAIGDYTYDLPDSKIARYPLEVRDQSKLLVYKKGKISDHTFQNLPEFLHPGDLLLFNNTRVIHARILFQKESGTKIEIFCLEPYQLNYSEAFAAKTKSVWTCMIGNAKRWKNETLEKVVQVKGKTILLSAKLVSREGTYAKVEFNCTPSDFPFGDVLFQAGLLPLPPYLNRPTEIKDEVNYQTYYAKTDGSVAAPTAGLHFTGTLLETIKNKKIELGELTLHVGAGTFMPVKSTHLEGHEMHRESILVSLQTLKKIHQTIMSQHSIVPVGTTSTRTLESMYWYGVKLLLKKCKGFELEINQWDPYDLPDHYSALDAIGAVIAHLEKNDLKELTGKTQLLIAPGYVFKVVSGMITNFHQPNSTLLLLVAALVGDDWIKIYKHALKANYRFLSFGDSSLLWKNN